MSRTVMMDDDCFSDLHKDVCGFRPSSSHEYYQPETTDARRAEIRAHYSKLLDEQFEAETEQDRIRIADFERAVDSIQKIAGCDRAKAIEYYVESLGADSSDLSDPGYICFKFWLPDSLESVIAPACKALREKEDTKLESMESLIDG